MKAFTAALALALLSLPAIGQVVVDGRLAEEQIVLKQIEASQRAIYAQNLGLTTEEGERFWPIYDQYEADIKQVNDKRVELLNDFADTYSTLSNADAEAMLGRIWKYEYEALRIRRKYASRVQRVLPDVKALRYVQIQARIDNQLLGHFMARMPLAR